MKINNFLIFNISEKVKSTNIFTNNIAVKIIFIGQSNAGKTSFLKTLKENRTVLMPAGSDGRTIGIELTVLNIDVHPDIRCYAYDFGGQKEYYPLHQAVVTPHSFYVLFVDLQDLYRNIHNDQHFNADVVHFYYTIYQRVHAPILQVVGTKAETLTAEQVHQCSERLLRGLSEIEQREISILEKRKVELIDSKKIKEFGSQTHSSKFHDFSVEDLLEKISEVERLLLTESRPKLPTEVIVVSSKEFMGIQEWKEDVAKRIFDHTDYFPSMEVPETWLMVSDSLDRNKANIDAVLDREQFSTILEDFKITNEVEQRICTQHFRVVGQIIFFEHHSSLKNTIFLYPDMILNAMSAVFNHEHFEDKFWEQNDTMRNLPLATRKMHKRNFQEYGITSKTVMHGFLQEKGLNADFDKLIALMMKIDLCFKCESVETNTDSVGDECNIVIVEEEFYIIPSLLKTHPSRKMDGLWPKTLPRAMNEMVVSLNMTTGMEPIGLFEQITTRINPHLRRRCDIFFYIHMRRNLYRPS